jgi:ribosomal protein S27E
VKKDNLYDEIKFPRLKLHENYNHIVYSNILCFPPSPDLLSYYNEFRETEAMRLREKARGEKEEVESNVNTVPTCPKCFKTDLRYSKREKVVYCRSCGAIVEDKKTGGI